MPLVIEHLTHTYNPDSPFQATAIHDVSLEIDAGDFLGVIGHTGSGKTTLVMHLNALLKPSAGRVLLDGQDINEKGYDRREARKRVGLVFQYPEHQLFEETVAQDVAFGPKNLGLSEAECAARVAEALGRVGLSADAIGAKSPFDLSGGQMRRVAIAGVLAMRPEILVLDEPTAGLDPSGREDVLSLVKSLHEEGATVVMVSHSMEDVARFATRIAVMNKGGLAMLGAPREIFSRGAELTAMGLDAPAGALLADALRARGMALPEGLFRLEDTREAILRALGKGARA